MTRVPWELEVVGGVDAVQIPHDEPEVIRDLACELGVDAVVSSPTRPQLQELNLELLATVGPDRIYAFTCSAHEPSSGADHS